MGHRCNAKQREGEERVTAGSTAARATQGDPASGSLSRRTALETEANWDRGSKPKLIESSRIPKEMSVGCFVFNWEPGFLFNYLKKV